VTDRDEVLPVTAGATFCATLVDEWARSGIAHAVVSPGSRSTPLALALAGDDRLTVHVHHDERAAGFLALGIAHATGGPAVVLTTSGTAAVELHPAIVEAHHSALPLIACTADRPPELRHVGAPQTIEQVGLYGGAVRWSVDPGVADTETCDSWRSLGSRVVAEATGSPPGPVHLNLPFREPLAGRAGPLPPGREAGLPWHEPLTSERHLDHHGLRRLAEHLRAHTGVIVAGGGFQRPEAVLVLAHTLGWPVLADPRSGCRLPDPAVIAHFDAVLRHEPELDLDPQVIVRLGSPPASKALANWLASRVEALQVAVDAHGRWFDPDHDIGMAVAADPAWVCLELAAQLDNDQPTSDWLATWRSLDDAAARHVADVLADLGQVTEPDVARRVVEAVPDGTTLVVSSSMPVRDVEWYSAPREGVRVVSNRGANGIDGVVSTAVGVALTGAPTVALVGDVAFLHDLTALLSVGRRQLSLVVVVVDNDGGGIFSFLPQAWQLDAAQFEQLFGTPHGVDLAAAAATHGIDAIIVESTADLDDEVQAGLAAGGAHVVIARTDRTANVGVHEILNRWR
jgi:2-succinyl-5-enolpyruvyl-6-hydroxy-3-cyclohexene-1-carboxylate synthase